jgi:hypothetical protein
MASTAAARVAAAGGRWQQRQQEVGCMAGIQHAA